VLWFMQSTSAGFQPRAAAFLLRSQRSEAELRLSTGGGDRGFAEVFRKRRGPLSLEARRASRAMTPRVVRLSIPALVAEAGEAGIGGGGGCKTDPLRLSGRGSLRSGAEIDELAFDLEAEPLVPTPPAAFTSGVMMLSVNALFGRRRATRRAGRLAVERVIYH
jgi:hypothetical protein